MDKISLFEGERTQPFSFLGAMVLELLEMTSFWVNVVLPANTSKYQYHISSVSISHKPLTSASSLHPCVATMATALAT